LSGAVPAPAAQLAQTGAGAVWGAVAGLGQDITGAAKMVYAYEQKLKEAEDKAEMVRLQGEVMETAKDTRHVLATMETDPNTGYEPLWDTYNATAAGWKAKLDENKILSNDAKKEMAIWLQRFDTSERLDVKELVNARRIQYAGAKLWTAQQQLMLAGDRAKALEILNERYRLRVIDDMQRAKEELEMDADIDMMQASKLIANRPLDAVEILGKRDANGAPEFFKNVSEPARRTLVNNAKVARNEAQAEYYSDLLMKQAQGTATPDDFEAAWKNGLISQNDYLRQVRLVAGTESYDYDPDKVLGIHDMIEKIADAGDVARVAHVLATSNLSPVVRGMLLNKVQSMYFRLGGAGAAVKDEVPDEIKDSLDWTDKMFTAWASSVKNDGPLNLKSRAQRLKIGDLQVAVRKAMIEKWKETKNREAMYKVRDDMIGGTALANLAAARKPQVPSEVRKSFRVALIAAGEDEALVKALLAEYRDLLLEAK